MPFLGGVLVGILPSVWGESVLRLADRGVCGGFMGPKEGVISEPKALKDGTST